MHTYRLWNNRHYTLTRTHTRIYIRHTIRQHEQIGLMGLSIELRDFADGAIAHDGRSLISTITLFDNITTLWSNKTSPFLFFE